MKTIDINKRVWGVMIAGLLSVHSVLFTACSDYLDVDPTNALMTGTFYKTESQVNFALNGLYGSLKPVAKYQFCLSEMRSDNVWITADTKQNDYVDIALFNANGLLTDATIRTAWADYYTIVASANTLLEKIDDVTFKNEGTKTQYKAEARFIRALAYFDLVRFFGNIPLAEHVLSTDEAFRLPQSTAKDIYEQLIVPDLQYAVENLAETALDYQGTAHPERVTNVAAKALLGKVYLTMAGFPLNQTDKKASATELFREVIDYADANGKYWANDMDEWENMWIHENDNKYFIFEIQYIAEKDEGNPMVTLSVKANPGNDWCSYNLITGTYIYIEKGLQNHYIERGEDNTYLDKRIYGTMNTRTGTGEDNESYTPTGNTFFVKFFENRFKRVDLGYSDMDAQIIDRTYWPQNYPIIRLEDIMLLYAECVGPTSEGYDMINKIRNRAGLSSLSGLSDDDFLKAVDNERRYELAEEGQRWHDLVRHNTYVETIKSMFDKDDTTAGGTYRALMNRVTADMYLYPIPQSQIEVRAGLYKQNPGY